MPSTKNSKRKSHQLKKLINNSDSDDDSEHELLYYVNDRVKLMKQVLRIIKPKKIRSMAPDCMKNMDITEISSILLEELLGISNKRLKYIFNGRNVDEDSSSSTDPEEEPAPVDVISLDDISDDDFIIDLDSPDDKNSKRKHPEVKKEHRRKKIKKEKQDKNTGPSASGPKLQENLMSVLELLELQARARAIRSQLALEASRKEETQVKEEVLDSDDPDAVIIESPKPQEIVIASSDSENEETSKSVVIDGAGAGTSNDVLDVNETSQSVDNSTTGRNENEPSENEVASVEIVSDITIPLQADTVQVPEPEPEMNKNVETSANSLSSSGDKKDKAIEEKIEKDTSEDQSKKLDTSLEEGEIDEDEETDNNEKVVERNVAELNKTVEIEPSSPVKSTKCKRKQKLKTTTEMKSKESSLKPDKKLEETPINVTEKENEKQQFEGIVINIDDDDIEEIDRN